jgi:DNA (cytosine-5)-methyltransferase 1
MLRQVPHHPPYIIENVAGAKDELIDPLMLCGAMFDRPTPRHRWFETSFAITPPEHPTCRGMAKRFAEHNDIDYRDMSVTGKSRRKGSIDVWRQIMEMPWATRARDLSEAIHPAYTEYLGSYLLTIGAAPRALNLP